MIFTARVDSNWIYGMYQTLYSVVFASRPEIWKNLVQEDMWKFDCQACYNTSDLKNSELYESIEKSLSIELNFQNDSKIDGESNSYLQSLRKNLDK